MKTNTRGRDIWLKQTAILQFDMAMISKEMTPPNKPLDLDVRVRSDKSLEIRWEGSHGGCNDSYQLEIYHFEFGGPMIHADHSTVMEVKGLAAHVLHPENLSKDSPWVVKVGVRTKSNDLLSDALVKQVCWDGELSAEDTEKDLKEKMPKLKSELEGFVAVRGKLRFLLLGGQNHGKSSFANHLYRCFNCDLSLNDQMDVASAGAEEKTVETKSLTVPLNGKDVAFIDTPAFANMSDDAVGKLQTVISSHFQDGTRRRDLPQHELSWFSKPPHGAIVVMSLVHWRDQPDEMQKYLEKMARAFKNASSGKVAFPYVVACTHCDVFLKDCQKEDPAKELQKAVEEIGKAALTEHVFPITSYKKKGSGSARNNEATLDLVSQLLTKAKRENTATVQNRNVRKCGLVVLSLAAARLLGKLLIC